jgi:hypothetical protein
MAGEDGVRRTELLMALAFGVSMLFWFAYSAVSKTLLPFDVYYPLWVGVVGSFAWWNRERIRRALRNWRVGETKKFFMLGFGAVLAEEILAALANHLTEGFSPLVFLARIGQFWMLNIFTFSGFILGWYIVLRVFAFSGREVFYIAGGWGLYAEKILFAIPSNPLFFIFTCVPTILTYGLIIMPAVLGRMPTCKGRRLHPVLKYPMTYLLIFVLSIPGILVLNLLREQFALLFPPQSLVPP